MQPGIIEKMGYTPLAMPKAGILPLTLLKGKSENIFQRLFFKRKKADLIADDIFSLFPLPPDRASELRVGQAKKVPNFKGFDIIDIKSLVEGNSGPSEKKLVTLAAKGGKNKNGKLLYTYKKVTSRQVHTSILLEGHMNRNLPATQIPGFLKELSKGNIYVITEVLQAEEFVIENAADFKNVAEITVDTVDEYITGKYNRKSSGQKHMLVSHKDPLEPVTFAIKVVKILPGHPKNNPGTYSTMETPLKSVRKKTSKVLNNTTTTGVITVK